MIIKELMIGDWVYVRLFGDSVPFPAKITTIQYNSYLGKGYCDWVDIDEWDELNPNDISPIPLTEEILEKNGFTKDEEIDQWYFKSNDRLDLGLLAVGIDDGCGTGFCVMRNGAITYYCKYVHELQHYLKLIGGAKEIEL